MLLEEIAGLVLFGIGQGVEDGLVRLFADDCLLVDIVVDVVVSAAELVIVKDEPVPVASVLLPVDGIKAISTGLVSAGGRSAGNKVRTLW